MIKAPAAPQSSSLAPDPSPRPALGQHLPLPPLQAPPGPEPIQVADSVNAAGKPCPYGLSPAQWQLIRNGQLK